MYLELVERYTEYVHLRDCWCPFVLVDDDQPDIELLTTSGKSSLKNDLVSLHVLTINTCCNLQVRGIDASHLLAVDLFATAHKGQTGTISTSRGVKPIVDDAENKTTSHSTAHVVIRDQIPRLAV